MGSTWKRYPGITSELHIGLRLHQGNRSGQSKYVRAHLLLMLTGCETIKDAIADIPFYSVIESYINACRIRGHMVVGLPICMLTFTIMPRARLSSLIN